ncbi:hypothetical protein TARUN_5982 [Trichoderma arundinaceum]|uniref:Uncharacterized protein n=1 Tax=Trichoderma arundinaceum TaxID=490622 RepID=A0A395NJR9_TRIAR|nr:hypothetical protein TARUN_5982 [Trichoderma arundinaceum]
MVGSPQGQRPGLWFLAVVDTMGAPNRLSVSCKPVPIHPPSREPKQQVGYSTGKDGPSGCRRAVPWPACLALDSSRGHSRRLAVLPPTLATAGLSTSASQSQRVPAGKSPQQNSAGVGPLVVSPTQFARRPRCNGSAACAPKTPVPCPARPHRNIQTLRFFGICGAHPGSVAQVLVAKDARYAQVPSTVPGGRETGRLEEEGEKRCERSAGKANLQGSVLAEQPGLRHRAARMRIDNAGQGRAEQSIDDSPSARRVEALRLASPGG